MKRLIVALISCMVLAMVPATTFAKKKIYIGSPTSSYPSGPRRGSDVGILTVDVSQESCELYITFIDDAPNLELHLTSNGVTYEEDELDAVSGQTISFDFDDYETGEYTLTIETNSTTIAIITIIIEE